MNEFTIQRRATSILLRSLPPHVEQFNAHLYAIVARRPGSEVPGERGRDVRLDPCIFDWESKTISIRVPLDINPGVKGVEDLHPDFFEAVQAAFLTLAHACT